MKVQIYTDTKTHSHTALQQQSFKGITKKLSRQMFIDGKKDIVELLNKTKPANTIVGELPPVMFYALPKVKNNPKIKETIDIFGQIADEIRAFRPTINSPREERLNRRPQSAVEKLRRVFVDFGLVKEGEPFDLIFLGEGNYKKAFKIEGVKDPKTNEELCLKVFHLVDKTPEWHKYKTHGNYAEINTSIYWKKTLGMETQRGKFYFGDIEHGFFVDKYIDKNVKPPKKIVNEEQLGIKLTDEVNGDVGHNRIHGYSIDPGGPRVVNRVKNKSRLARKIFERFKSTPIKHREFEWEKLNANNTKYSDIRQKQAGLAIAIKLLPHRSRYFDKVLAFHNDFADIGLGYVVKYLKNDNAKKYFEILMKRNNPITQTVLLNEIPLIARKKIKIDDLDVPRGEIQIDKLEYFYDLAKAHVLPEVEQHLASYIHLLPSKRIIPEAQRLISKHNYEINDRLLHKIKFVKDEEFSFSDKMEILKILEKQDYSDMPKEQADFLKKKTQEVKIYVIRNQLED